MVRCSIATLVLAALFLWPGCFRLGYAEEIAGQGFTAERLLGIALEDGEVTPGILRTYLSTVAWSPLGDFFVTALSAESGGGFELIQFDSETLQAKTIGVGAGLEFSPNGKFLSYFHRDGTLRVIAREQDELEFIAELSIGMIDRTAIDPRVGFLYEWAPDSSGLAYIQRGGDKDPEIRFFELETGVDQTWFSTPHDMEALSFGPSHRLYFAFIKSQQDNAAMRGPDVRIAYLDKGTVHAVTVTDDIGNHTSLVKPTISPDGQHLAYNYSRDPGYFVFPVNSGRAIHNVLTKETSIFDAVPFGGSRITWSEGGESFHYKCKTGAFLNSICFVDTDTGDVRQVVLEDAAHIGGFSISPDGSKVAWISRDLYDCIRIRVALANGSDVKTVYEQPRTDLSHTPLGEAQTIRWTSYDGLELEGLLIFPVGYENGTAVPLVVDIHGGPYGGVSEDGSLLQASPLEWQMWAAKGYATFVADYRNGQIAGRDWRLFRRPPAMMFSEPDAKDVLAGVDHLINLGIADPTRIAAIGHSYGSRVLNTLLTLSDRFAVAISKEGTSDMRPPTEAWSSNPRLIRTWQFLMNANPDTLPRLFAESSPIVSSHKIKTPLLFVRAGNGAAYAELFRERLESFVNAINESGGQAEALFFADDQHTITKEKNARIMITKTVEWIDRYLGAPGGDLGEVKQ